MTEVLHMEYEKVQQRINDMVGDNVKKLAQLFPAAVKDGEVDFEVLKEELGQFAEVDSEKYELTWAGKKNAKKITQEDIVGKTLKFIPEDSKNADTTENLYIEGDNLEVLKLLRQNYYGAVKMIYIDPPYNTGNDFVYNDMFEMNKEDSDIAEGDTDELGERFVVNIKSSNRFHAKWLTNLYSRLKVSKDLLKEDGVIFISIDDNEITNLRKICEEIFGEDNFVAQFIWKSKLGKVGTTSTISAVHEYILCFAKNISLVNFKMIETKNDGRKENLRQWGIADRREDRPSMWYPIIINDVEVYPFKEDGTEGRWRVGEEKAKELLEDGKLELVRKGNDFNIYRKFDSGVSVTPYDTLLLDEIGTTAKGAVILKEMGMGKIFDYSKPIELIKFFALLSTQDDDIIMDYFSGSATSAHAIMQLNCEETTKRKFIMIQINEKTDEKTEAYKNKYSTICEIGKERIRRAGEKIKQENPNAKIDIGFKVFRVADTNIKWNSLMDAGQLDLAQIESTPDLVDFMPGAKDIDIVYELMLRQRDVALSETLKLLSDIGNRTYLYASSYLVCLETEITVEHVNKLAEIDPLPIKFIFRDSAFKDDIALKDETFRRLKALIEKNAGNSKVTYTVEFI